MKFLRDEEGAIISEYALVLVLIAVACILGVSAITPALKPHFEKVAAILADGAP